MMVGSIRWNAILGAIGFFFTFITSISSNIFMTALLRSTYCGIILFIIAFAFRWILGSIDNGVHKSADLGLGNNFDVISPEETQAMHDIIRKQLDEAGSGELDFAPLNPPKLISKNNLDPEELVKAIRHISED